MRRLVASSFFFAMLLQASVASATGVCIGDPRACTGGGGGGGGATNPFANVQLSISNGTSSQSSQAARTDGRPGISNNGVDEGQACMFTIHRSGPNNKPASVDWRTKDGTAVASTSTFAQPNGSTIQGDYIPDSGTANFKPEQRDAHVFIQTLEDFQPEPDEHFFVILKNPRKAVIADGKGKCTIFANSGGD